MRDDLGRPEPAVSRWEVYAQVFLRALFIAVVGGAAIGLVTSWAFAPRLAPLGTFLGTTYGVMLGITAGPIVGGLLAALVVPYRDAKWTRLIAVTTATASVAVFFMFAFGEPWRLEQVELTAAAFGVGGAAVSSPYLVRWYIRRAEHLAPVDAREGVL